MSSLKDEYTLCFLNFPIIGFSNSFANWWFEIISLLKALPEDFLSKILQKNEARPFCYPSYYEFLAKLMLYNEILYQKLFFSVNL